jgi:hypothetical protein
MHLNGGPDLEVPTDEQIELLRKRELELLVPTPIGEHRRAQQAKAAGTPDIGEHQREYLRAKARYHGAHPGEDDPRLATAFANHSTALSVTRRLFVTTRSVVRPRATSRGRAPRLVRRRRARATARAPGRPGRRQDPDLPLAGRALLGGAR